MAKSIKKEMEQKTPKTSAKPVAEKSYPVDEQALEAQAQRLKKAAAAGAGSMQRIPIGQPRPELAVSEAAESKPLATIAALWPAGQQTPAPAPTPAPLAPAEPAQKMPAMRPTPVPTAIPAKPTKPQTVAVKLMLTKPEANSVSVCGEFNEWAPGAAPMTRRQDGQWEAVLHLRPGRYQYKFVADGQWLSDPTARENIPNQHGSLNSVLTVS